MMKKIQKNDLRLEKEVITALTASDLTGLRGGQGAEPRSEVWVTKDMECRTRNAGCQSQHTCLIESVDVCLQTKVNDGCLPVSPVTEQCNSKGCPIHTGPVTVTL